MLKWILLVVLVGLVFCGISVYRDRTEGRRQAEMLRRLRASSMYDGLYSLLKSLPETAIERVTVRTEGVDIVLLNGKRRTYDFRQHRMDPLKPDLLLVLTQAIAVDVPILQDRSYYSFEPPARRDPEPRYSYVIRHNRKDYLLRAMRNGEVR